MKYFLLILCVLCTGCSHLGQTYDATNTNLRVANEQVDEQVRVYVDGTVDALAELPKEKETPETELATSLATGAQQITGLPKPYNKLDVPGLLSKDPAVRALALVGLKERELYVAKVLKTQEKLEQQLSQAQDELVRLGRIKEQETNKSTLSKVWGWLTATFGIGGLIALCICCPALLPVLGTLLGWVVGKIPSLIGFVGTTSASLVKNIISGVEETKTAIKQADPEKTYTKAEVLALLSRQLKDATDPEDKHAIALLKARLGY